MPKHQRLKSARIRAGFKTARAAATKLDVPYGTYSSHEGGSRGIKEDELKKYAEFFGVPAAWLAFGQESKESSLDFTIIVGTVGSSSDKKITFYKGSQIEEMPFDIEADISNASGEIFRGAQRLPMPSFMAPVITPSLKLMAIKVIGTNLGNSFDVGGVLYFEIEQYEDIDGFHDSICACWLKDGTAIVSRPTPTMIIDFQIVSVSPLVTFLTRTGLSRWLETLASSFLQTAQGFEDILPE